MDNNGTIAKRVAQAGPLTWVLAAVCGWALLTWLLALLGLGAQVAQAQPSAMSALPSAPAELVDAPALAADAAAIAHPLFSADRQPRAFLATGAGDVGEGAGSGALDFILTGVVISPQVRLVTLQPSAGGEPQRVREGSAPAGAEGWRLVEVEPRRAIFEGSGGRLALDLRTFGSAGQPPHATADQANDAEPAADSDEPAAEATPADTARIAELRRRIEARRAQLQTETPPPAAAPTPRPKGKSLLQPVKE